MAQSIINSGSFSVTRDGQIVGQETISANAVIVFEDGDFVMTKVPSFTIWQDTTEPLEYTITLTNQSGVTVDTITITDTFPVADATNAGLTLDISSIMPSIIPADGVTFDTSASTPAQLVVTTNGTIAADAVLTITFNTNYVEPTT